MIWTRKKRAEALWAYSITHERIMERLVRKGAFTQERADEILDMLTDELCDQSIEDYSKSAGFQNVIESLLRPQLSPKNFISLTELAREENRDNPSYVIQSWLRSRNTIEFLRLWEKENNPDFNETGYNQLIEQINLSSFTLTAKKWIEQNVDEVYVTLFEDRPELETLVTLLSRWGFEDYGTKTSTGEKVLTKQMQQYLPELSPRKNFPNLKYEVQKFILPILPKYHTSLLPDSILRNENENDFVAKTPYRYALQKVYISFAPERNIHPGDIVIFYRNGVPGNAGHTAVLTSVAIVEEAMSDFMSKEEYMRHVQNRSVFTTDELEQFWQKYHGNQVVLKFIFVKSLTKHPILKFLWDTDIVASPGGPRPFTRISDEQFNMILRESQTDLSRYWR